MRKAAVLLASSFICSILSADIISTDRSIDAELPVYWDLSRISEAYEYDFEFCKDAAGTPLDTVPGSQDKLLEIHGSSTDEAKGEGEVYVRWTIEAPMLIKLSLSADGAMSGVKDNQPTGTPIHWSASWSSDEGKISEGKAEIISGSTGNEAIGTYGEAIAVEHNGLLIDGQRVTKSSGYCRVQIHTDDIYSVEPGDYTGHLTLYVYGDK